MLSVKLYKLFNSSAWPIAIRHTATRLSRPSHQHTDSRRLKPHWQCEWMAGKSVEKNVGVLRGSFTANCVFAPWMATHEWQKNRQCEPSIRVFELKKKHKHAWKLQINTNKLSISYFWFMSPNISKNIQNIVAGNWTKSSQFFIFL